MFKLFLSGRVPNEGARRLAAWLNATPVERASRAMAAAGVDVVRADRLISGELIPGADERFAIALATNRAVLVRDWSTPAQGMWGDPVPVRQMRCAA